MDLGEEIPGAGYATRSREEVGAIDIDLALMRAVEPQGAARVEHLGRVVPGLATTAGGHLRITGAAGAAMAQWACRPLREAMRAMAGARDAASYLDALRETLERNAPDVVRQMPLADGQRPARRARKSAFAEGQASLFDLMPGQAAPSRFDALPNLVQNASMVNSVLEEVHRGNVPDGQALQRAQADEVRAALQTDPDWVREVSKEELEDHLTKLVKRYQQRCYQLVDEGMAKALADNPQISGTAEHFRVESRSRRRLARSR